MWDPTYEELYPCFVQKMPDPLTMLLIHSGLTLSEQRTCCIGMGYTIYLLEGHSVHTMLKINSLALYNQVLFSSIMNLICKRNTSMQFTVRIYSAWNHVWIRQQTKGSTSYRNTPIIEMQQSSHGCPVYIHEPKVILFWNDYCDLTQKVPLFRPHQSGHMLHYWKA